MPLSDRIRQLRQKAHMSQEKLAEEMGVSRQAVAKWESGQSAPSTEKLYRLAEIFGTTVDFVLGDSDGANGAARELFALQNAEEQRQKEAKRLKGNIKACGVVLLGYLALFLLMKAFTMPSGNYSVAGWLFGWQSKSYVFGWLLARKLYYISMCVSLLPTIFGKHRFGYVTFGAFAAGILFGELFGPYPRGAFYGITHYGWLIWGIMFMVGIIAGVVVEKVHKKKSAKV